MFGFVNRKVATWTTRLEYHRTESENRYVVVIKLVILQFINCYLSLFYTAFVLQDIDKLRKRLGFLIIAKQALVQFLEVFVPMCKGIARLTRATAKPTKNDAGKKSIINRALLECSLETYSSTFQDYLEIWVQFGLVTLFASVFPIAGICALVSIAIEWRSDAFRLMRVNRRPFPLRTSGIGGWLPTFEALSYCATITNVALIGIVYLSWGKMRNVPPSLQNVPLWQWVLILAALEHLIVWFKVLLAEIIPDIPSTVAHALRVAKRDEERRAVRAYDIRHEVMKRLVRTSSSRDSIPRETLSNVLSKEGGVDSIVEYCKLLEQRREAAVDALIRMKKDNKQLKRLLVAPPMKDVVVYLAPVAAFAVWVAVSLWSWIN